MERQEGPNAAPRRLLQCPATLAGMCAGAAAVLLMMTACGVSAQTMTIPGTLEVGASGAATYTIPIVVPPGTAGVAPALSLEYSSQGGDGIVGLGWSLGGLPSVGRCPQTIAQDGVSGSINYDGNDRFCLGGQRLVAISGAYGADLTEYRTEIESFSRILSHGTAGTGPAWFEVHTKSGQAMEFGNTADSQILAQGKATARAWAVNKVSDTKGNYFAITYAVDAANGQAYPSSIVYTGNTAAALSPYNTVQFVYAGRSDVTPKYIGGSLIQTLYLLTDIKTYSGGTLVADYKLAYENGGGTPRSKLAGVTLCDGANACLPPTTFGWQGQAILPGTAGLAAGWGGNQIFAADFNGDGKTDLFTCPTALNATCYIYYSNGAGGLSQSGFTPAWGAHSVGVTDFNGDGMADFLVCPPSNGHSGGGGTCVVYYSTGAGFAQGSFAPAWAGYSIVTGDFDGDGRSDFLACPPVGGLCVTYYSTGTGFTQGSFAPGWSGYLILASDFNGDGKQDILACPPASGGICNVYYSNGTSFAQGSFAPAWGGYQIGGGDFNGDGSTDLFACPPTIGAACAVYYSTGIGFFPGAFTAGWGAYGISTGDFNGDGKSDLFVCPLSHTATGSCFLYLSTGPSFASSGFTASWEGYSIVVGDWAGAGVSSFLANPNIAGQNVQQYLTSFAPELVVSFGNGLTATAISYAPLTNPAVYTKDTTSTYPTQDMGGPLYVVSRVNASNGIGGIYSTTYAYAGAKADLNGRGFLGFRQMAGTDLQTGVAQTTNYLQGYPFIGLAASAQKALGSAVLNSNASTYASTPLGGTRAQVSVARTVAASSDLDGSSVPTVTTTYQYDAFGNATQIVVSTTDGYSKTTNNTYINDATNWFLGRLTAASVTSVAPAPPTPSQPAPPPDLSISMSNSGTFIQGQSGSYSISVSNVGAGPTASWVFVTDTLPQGLTATGISGPGWNCALATLECSRNDQLAAGSSYPTIIVTVAVAANAPASVTNVAVVAGGDEVNTANDTASNATTIVPATPDLTVSVSHYADFVVGTAASSYGSTGGNGGGTYTIMVANVGYGPTIGAVTVVDTLPAGLSVASPVGLPVASLSGPGWSCNVATVSCARSDALGPGASYPSIVLLVDVGATTAPSVTNVATVSGGGETNTGNDVASDLTNIVSSAPDLTIAMSHVGEFTVGGTGTYTITVRNIGSAQATGAVTVADSLPPGLTASALSGVGWSCSVATVSCTRSDTLGPGSAYEAVFVTVSVASGTPASVTNVANVSGGNETNTNNDTASDATQIVSPPALSLTCGFPNGSVSLDQYASGEIAQLSVTVRNGGTTSSSGTITVTDNLPTGLIIATPNGFSGTGWSCAAPAGGSSASCTFGASLGAGASTGFSLSVKAANPNVVGTYPDSATISGGGLAGPFTASCGSVYVEQSL
jgi:uncharacterized repeat protein (TIGR01451 family)